MASQGGLTRRRGGGGGATAGSDEEGGSSTPTSKPQASQERAPETSYTAENGHKIAYDPRDLAESEEMKKQPKLTLMEEVLLMGLKDKQVCSHCLFVPGWLRRPSHAIRTELQADITIV